MTQLLNNRYQIVSTLGRGGFGETFLAEDTYMPSRRRCVIKQLKPLVDNPEVHQLVQERFQREAAILETLGEGHSQIPALYAYFSEEGQFYLVQEWVEGDTLTSRIKQQGLFSEDAVRDLLVHLLPVLEYIHSQGIIHRDLKPDNIILRYRDRLPVLIDFGAVRETMGTQLNSHGNLTSSIVIGTPGFMPSEQAAGRPLFSSDLFSLALTAIYVLTGKLPQQLEVDSYTGEIIWPPVEIEANLKAVLERASKSHPRDRFPSARAMLDALQSHSSAVSAAEKHEIAPTLAPPEQATLPFSSPRQDIPPTIPLSTPPSTQQKRKPNLILGSLIGAGFISAAIVAGFFFLKPKEIAKQVVTQPGNLENNRCFRFVDDPAPPTNVRSSPEVKPDNIVGTLENGTNLSVVTQEKGWLKISAPVEGWVAENRTKKSCTSQSFTESPTQSTQTPNPSSPATPSPGNNYAWLSQRKVADADLAGKTAFELDLMRNSIYANYGRKFTSPELQAYFNNQAWYRPRYEPNEFPDSLLSVLEMQNAISILEYQNKNNLRWIQDKPQAPSKPSSKQALNDYYSAINSTRYEVAWNMLSSRSHNDRNLHPQGYTSYTDWWQTVDRVELEDVRILEEGVEIARLEVRLKYYMKSGTETSNLVRFKLVWDEATGRWLIDDAKLL